MFLRFLCSASALALFAAPAFATDGADSSAETIIVTAPRLTATLVAAETEAEQPTGPDGAAFVARQPGAALVANGALSGQVQMRGMFGERILLRINGQRFATGGPNAMDPVMHYAPMLLIDRAEIARGISPVRDGPGLGGGVNIILKHASFGDGTAMAPQVDLASQYRSVDDSIAAGGLVGLANDRFRIGVIGSLERGDDVRFPGGRIDSTSHRRMVYGIHGGFRAGSGEFSLEYRRQETGRSGNPPFAMDIIYFHTDFLRAGYAGELADNVRLETQMNYTGVVHRMNNFTLRPAPVVAQSRQSDTYADTVAADVSLRFGAADRHIRVGADFEIVDKGYQLYNPFAPAFFVHPLDRAQSDRVGGFVEWRTGFGSLQSEIGVRLDRHGARASASRFGSGIPAGPAMLANAFANADRNWAGTSVDAAWRLWVDMGTITPRLTLARKSRAPSLVERFSWLPTEASGGLADGNIYVGDTQLRIERAWIAELGFDWHDDRAYARPVVYFRRVDDFIQGVPFDATPGVINTTVEMVSSASGDPTPLRFANRDADIWGADIAFGTAIAGPLRLDGVVSYVRARRRDIADNLYRIAPANGRLALSWDASRWAATIEGLIVGSQNHVSLTNGEQPSDSYFLLGIRGHWLAQDGLRIDAGVENLLDAHYTDHLAGYNRITGSDVSVGSRLPGPGRSGFVRLRWAL